METWEKLCVARHSGAATKRGGEQLGRSRTLGREMTQPSGATEGTWFDPAKADQATEGAWEKRCLPGARLQPLGGGGCVAQEKPQVALWQDTATKGSSGDA